MSKYSKLATLSVAVFVGLLVAYLGGYQAAKTTDSSTVSAETTPKPEKPVLAEVAESPAPVELAYAQVAIHAAREAEARERLHQQRLTRDIAEY